MKNNEIKLEVDRRELAERRELDRVLREREIEGKVELAKTLTEIGETLKHLHSGQDELKLNQKEFSGVFDKHLITDNKRYTDVMLEMNFQRGQNKYWYIIIAVLGGIIAISSVIATSITLLFKFYGDS